MNEVRAYARAKRLVEQRFGFLVHLAIYIPVCLIVAALDLSFDPHPRAWWIMAWGWGIGLTAHFLAAYVLADRSSRTPLAETLRARRVAFLVHLFTYANAVLLFVTVNLSDPDLVTQQPDEGTLLVRWWPWPAIFWGIGVFYHWFFTFVVRGWRVKKLKQLWTLGVMKEIDGVERPEKLDSPTPDA